MKLCSAFLVAFREVQMAVADQKSVSIQAIPSLAHLSIAMLQPPNCLTPLYAQRISDFLNGELDRTALHDYFSTAERHRGSFDLALSQFTDEERRRYDEAAVLAAAPAANHPETINLAAYASKATLPSMPWIPRQQQFSTSREPNHSRNLRSLHVIPEEEFNRRVLSCSYQITLTATQVSFNFLLILIHSSSRC